MKRLFLACAATLVALAAFSWTQAQADGVSFGGAGSATSVLASSNVVNAGTILAEIGYDAQYSPRLLGEIVQFTGISAEGGGPQLGVGYRQYFKVGSQKEPYGNRPKWVGIGMSGFGLGSDTPAINETSIFVGPELLVRLPVGDQTTFVTGFVGLYPSVAGQLGTSVLRSGVSVSASIN